MKIAVIGGGSSYSPELVDGLFSRLESIPVTELWMMDPAEERLAITSGLCQRMAERHGNPFTVHATTDMREAVRDSKYVVTQLRVGGIQARIEDEKLGFRYGIPGQETTGVGGFAKALRTIPRILDIARAMEDSAPDAMLVNFTNPSGIVTESVIRNSPIKVVGLCNIPVGIIMELVEKFGYAMEDVQLDYVGLNHLAWIRGVTVAGKDVWDDAFDFFIEQAEEEWTYPDVVENMRTAMRALNMGCNPYLQYFYATDAIVKHHMAKDKTRGEEVLGIEDSLFAKYQQPELKEKPPELSQRGGAHYSTAAFHLINALENNTKNHQVVCCRNGGAIPTFDDDAALELTAEIGSDGARALPQAAPHHAIRGLMQQVKAYETLTVQAALTGDRDTAYQALLNNPLTPNANKTRELLNELLEINEPHLQGTFFNPVG